MCLHNAVRINTEKDIVCYKLFWKDSDRPDKLYSIYRYSPYKLNVTRSTRTKTPKIYYSQDKRGRKEYSINESAFHSFANYGEVKKFQKNRYNGGSVIVKCIIPKDSAYIYEGTFEGIKSYASQKLKPMEIMEQSIFED